MTVVPWLTGMQLWRMKYSPFMRYSQLKLCRRLISVPVSTFRRLAEQIGDPKGELIFLFNTSRCGSTLLTQVYHHSSDYVITKTVIVTNLLCTKYVACGWAEL